MASDPDGRAAASERWETEPWAVALNQSSATPDAEITLLGCTVVGDIVRISGVVVVRRPGMRLSHVPTLEIDQQGRLPLRAISGHLLPHAGLTWVTWIFGRPRPLGGHYTARIASCDLATQTARSEVAAIGPWRFAFGLPEDPL